MAEVVDIRLSREVNPEWLRRPIGTVVLAAILLFCGTWLAGGGIHRFIEALLSDSAGLTPIDCIGRFHLIFVGLLAVAASIGLLHGSRLGWWVAVALTYVLFATFVLVPPFHRGFEGQVPRLVIKAAVCGAVWLYLHKKNVRNFFGMGAPALRTHAIVFAICVASILAVGVW